MPQRSDQPAGSASSWRAGVLAGMLALLVGVLTLVGASAAGAAPRDVGEIPASLQKYLPRSPGWDASPWMTSPACRDMGGDFSAWATAVITDTPELLRVFNTELYGPDAPQEGKPRNYAILAGYQQLAKELQATIPAGYCVDDMKRWAGTDPDMRPFGFAWGLENTTMFSCTDTEPGVKQEEYLNKWVGAERAPCDGFRVSCENAGAEQQRCDTWNAFSDDYTDRVYSLRAAAINDNPATGQGDVDTRVKSLDEIANDVAMGWFGDLTMTIAKGAATLLGEAMTFWTRSDRSSMLESPAIESIQNMLWYVGAVLLVSSVMWQGIMLLYKRKPDPLVNTGMGLLSFVGWSTLGGTAAVLMYEAGLALTSQVLDEAINTFSNTMAVAMQANVVASVALVFFLAIIMFLLACIQWFLGFFRMGALVILLALLPVIAAGQINESTKPWLPKAAGWALAIIWYQPVSGIIYAIGFVLIGDGTDNNTILTGMATLGMAVVAMPTMHRFFDWGGQKFASSGGGGGGAMAAGAAASALGGGGAAAHSRYMDRSGTARRGGGTGGGDGDGSVGPLPPVSAHTGDGPDGSAGAGRGGAAGGGRPRQQAGAVTPAAAGTGTGSGAGGGTGSGSPAGAVGAAAAAAQAAKDRAGGAMTDGADGRSGPGRGSGGSGASRSGGDRNG